MEFGTLFQLLWRRKWAIVLTTLMAFLVSFVGTSLTTPVYSATSTLRVITSSSGLGAWTQYDINYADRLMRTYAYIARSQPVVEELVERLALDRVPSYEVEPILSTELLTITVEDEDRILVANTANALADILIEQQEALYGGGMPTATSILLTRLNQLEDEIQSDRDRYEDLYTRLPAGDPQLEGIMQSINLRQDLYNSLVTQYEEARTAEQLRENTMYLVEPASVPGSPKKPNKILNLALGGMVGLLGGCVLALLLSRLDSRLFDVAEIVRLVGAPLIGEIPRLRHINRNPICDGDTIEGEAFRRLYASCSVRALDKKDGKQILLFASPSPKAGKSTIVTNLAIAFARAKHRVLLIDADLARPRIHEILGISNTAGLYDLLAEKGATVEDVLQHYLELGKGPMVFLHGANGTPRIMSLNQATAEELVSLPGIGMVTAQKIVDYRDSIGAFSSVNDLALVGIRDHTLKQLSPFTSDQSAVLDVIPSGLVLEEAVPAVRTATLRRLLTGLRERYDVILIDSPAFLAVNTALILASVADGVVIVARPAKVRPAHLRAMCDQLAATGTPIVGVVSNQVSTLSDYNYYRSRSR